MAYFLLNFLLAVETSQRNLPFTQRLSDVSQRSIAEPDAFRHGVSSGAT
jgi:hypothetical protein